MLVLRFTSAIPFDEAFSIHMSHVRFIKIRNVDKITNAFVKNLL